MINQSYCLWDLGCAGGWRADRLEVRLELGSHALDAPRPPLHDVLQTVDVVPERLQDTQTPEGQRDRTRTWAIEAQSAWVKMPTQHLYVHHELMN